MSTQTMVNSGSWVIVEKRSGLALFETFDSHKVDRLNTKKYQAVPILEYLVSINSEIALQ